MSIEDATESDAETNDSDSTFEKIINLPFMNSKREGDYVLPYSRLGHECFDTMYYKLAKMLPVYALGHDDAEIRRLANEIFQKLFLNQNS